MRFRRREEETYDEQLLREAGLDQPAPVDPQPGLHPADSALGAIAGIGARPSEWDVVTTAEAPEIGGDDVEFATLPAGDIIVDTEVGDADLSPLAEAIEQQLRPPYRARARRHEGALWAVAARRIEVRRLQRDGDEFEDVEGDLVTRGSRLDGDFWEIQVERL
jgi:hypothetical protein